MAIQNGDLLRGRHPFDGLGKHKGVEMQGEDWFYRLTGLASDDFASVQQGIVLEAGNHLYSLANHRRLQAGYLSLPALADMSKPSGTGRVRLQELVADVQDLHAHSDNAGAVFQVASQFNLLEMIGPHVRPEDGIAGYVYDQTQGPACAMACAAGTLYRNYFVKLGEQTGQSEAVQFNTLADLEAALGNAERGLWEMVNGYLLPHAGGLQQVTELIWGREAELRALIRVGMQADTEVTLPNCGHTVTQVYASAVPMAYASAGEREWEALARLVLEAAYELTLLIATQSPKKRVFLTRLGGGAFGNPDAWIDDAIVRAIEQVQGADLEVFLVSHLHSHAHNQMLINRCRELGLVE